MTCLVKMHQEERNPPKRSEWEREALWKPGQSFLQWWSQLVSLSRPPSTLRFTSGATRTASSTTATFARRGCAAHRCPSAAARASPAPRRRHRAPQRSWAREPQPRPSARSAAAQAVASAPAAAVVEAAISSVPRRHRMRRRWRMRRRRHRARRPVLRRLQLHLPHRHLPRPPRRARSLPLQRPVRHRHQLPLRIPASPASRSSRYIDGMRR